MERIRTYAREAGRDPTEIGIDGRSSLRGTPDEWVGEMTAWKELGATHLSVYTMGAGLSTPDGHIDALRRYKEATA